MTRLAAATSIVGLKASPISDTVSASMAHTSARRIPTLRARNVAGRVAIPATTAYIVRSRPTLEGLVDRPAAISLVAPIV